MGVTISKPAINIREKLTEASAVVPYEQRQFHFDNLVTNGTFDSGYSPWNALLDATLSVASGAMRLTNGASGYATASLEITCDIGSLYQIAYDVLSPSTTHPTRVIVDVDELQTSPFIASTALVLTGTQTFSFVATAATHYLQFQIFNATVSAAMDFDNISVYTSDGTDVAFTMPKGWKPLHVYDDGVLQREGSAEDYEVTFDGFNYYVKPTVANPGARNTVIGVRA